MQREAPAAQVPTLFEQNEVLRQTYTVTVAEGLGMQAGDCVHAIVNVNPGGGGFVVTDAQGRRVGAICGESGRVLAETLQRNQLAVVSLTVTAVVPVTGDARVQIIPE